MQKKTAVCYGDRTDQTPGSNLFYLPRYLPRGIYFLFTRRPYARKLVRQLTWGTLESEDKRVRYLVKVLSTSDVA
ncbi:MAG: hypothetical protein V7K21_24860 [Nostoc sp.]|uniref:hypothetical protein n=1 Tax=Nostoc sp. TaxID=1180 RepID=UPI002FF62E46